MNTLLLVDGHSLLFQMFYGMPARIKGKGGKPVQALIGFTGALLRTIQMVSASHAAVIFDGENGSYRTDEFREYKNNRKDYTDVPEEENPFAQLEGIKKILNHLKIKHYEVVERLEADDVIASYVYKYNKKYNIYILSSDTDFMQLIDTNVKIFRYRGKSSVIYDAQAIVEKYGIKPEYFADYKALAGDRADNIKGIEKVGVKTAAWLINNYGHIHEIIGSADLIEKKNIQTAIINNIDKLNNNLNLIKPAIISKLPFQAHKLRFSNKSYKTMEILRALEYL